MEKSMKYSEFFDLLFALNNIDVSIEDKLSYYIKKFLKKNERHRTEYREKYEEIQIEHCYEDPITKCIVYDTVNGQQIYKFEKEKLKAKLKAEKELLNQQITVEMFEFTKMERFSKLDRAVKENLMFILGEEIPEPTKEITEKQGE